MELASFRANHKLVRPPNLVNFGAQNDLYSRSPAFIFEHFHDVAGRVVAEELAECFLVIGDAMLLDQGDKVRRRVPGQR